MKYATMVSLIRKGQITIKTVVRGPTTNQFWRFAGRVKGISREFGLCWSCGLAIQPTATTCASCSKSQELPPNPDVLLENDPQPNRAVYVSVSPKGAGPHDPRSRSSDADANEPIPHAQSLDPDNGYRPSETPRGSRPAMPSAAATMAAAAGLPNPELAGPDLQTRPHQQPSREKMLSPRELAAAFSLQFNPKANGGYANPAPYRPRRTRLWIALAAILLLGSAGAVGWYIPAIHDPVVARLRQATGLAQTTETPLEPTKIDRSTATGDRPDWAMKPVVESPPVTSATTPPASPTASLTVAAAAPPQPSVVTPTVGTPTSADGTSSSPTGPAANPIVADGTKNDVQPDSSAKPPNPADAAPPGASDADLDRLAMSLRSNGLDAEAKHDYAGAQYYYEQIEKLPKDHWPADTDELLKSAQRMNQSAATDQH